MLLESIRDTTSGKTGEIRERKKGKGRCLNQRRSPVGETTKTENARKGFRQSTNRRGRQDGGYAAERVSEPRERGAEITSKEGKKKKVWAGRTLTFALSPQKKPTRKKTKKPGNSRRGFPLIVLRLPS